jgi:hypothetical protein
MTASPPTDARHRLRAKTPYVTKEGKRAMNPLDRVLCSTAALWGSRVCRDGEPHVALVETARRPRKGSLLAASRRAGWNLLVCVLAQLGRRAGL